MENKEIKKGLRKVKSSDDIDNMEQQDDLRKDFENMQKAKEYNKKAKKERLL